MVFEFVPSTFPILLSIERVVGVPPEIIQYKVTDCLAIITDGLAVNELITGAAGGGVFTVIVEMLLVIVPVESFAVILAIPSETGVTTPYKLTDATAVLSDVQVKVPVEIEFSFWSLPITVSCWVDPPTVRVAVAGEMVIVVKTGIAFTITVIELVTEAELFVAVIV